TVNRGGGLRTENNSLAVSLAFSQLFVGDRTGVEVCKFGEGFVDLSFDEVSSKVRIPSIHERRQLRGRRQQPSAKCRQGSAERLHHVLTTDQLPPSDRDLELRLFPLSPSQAGALLVEIQAPLAINAALPVNQVTDDAGHTPTSRYPPAFASLLLVRRERLENPGQRTPV